MTETKTLYNNVAPLQNVAALLALIKRVQDRPYGLPGMAVFYGPSGYGKSVAATYASNRFQAVTVQVKSVWTARYFCEAILGELAVKPQRTIPYMVNQIAEELARTGRPLLIDETDNLIPRKMIELVRDVYESSGATIILIGEEELPQKLTQWERVHGRMLDWVAAKPAISEDVNHLAPIYCPGVQLDQELKDYLLKVSQHSVRRISVNLRMVHEFALEKALTKVRRADWGKAGFFTGEAPTPRRKLS